MDFVNAFFHVHPIISWIIVTFFAVACTALLLLVFIGNQMGKQREREQQIKADFIREVGQEIPLLGDAVLQNGAILEAEFSITVKPSDYLMDNFENVRLLDPDQLKNKIEKAVQSRVNRWGANQKTIPEALAGYETLEQSLMGADLSTQALKVVGAKVVHIKIRSGFLENKETSLFHELEEDIKNISELQIFEESLPAKYADLFKDPATASAIKRKIEAKRNDLLLRRSR